MSITEADQSRIQRATEQAGNYLVLPNLDVLEAFDVVGKHGKCYTVTPEGCSCPDSQNRNPHCKHWHLVRGHVAQLIATAELEKRRAATRARRDIDFPEN